MNTSIRRKNNNTIRNKSGDKFAEEQYWRDIHMENQQRRADKFVNDNACCLSFSLCIGGVIYMMVYPFISVYKCFSCANSKIDPE